MLVLKSGVSNTPHGTKLINPRYNPRVKTLLFGGGQIRRAMLVLKDFSELLESVPPTDEFQDLMSPGTRKVDIRLPGKGNSNSHGARPVY